MEPAEPTADGRALYAERSDNLPYRAVAQPLAQGVPAATGHALDERLQVQPAHVDDLADHHTSRSSGSEKYIQQYW